MAGSRYNGRPSYKLDFILPSIPFRKLGPDNDSIEAFGTCFRTNEMEDHLNSPEKGQVLNQFTEQTHGFTPKTTNF
jgi:hypothetical protein